MKYFRSRRPRKSSLLAGRQAILQAIENGDQLDRILLSSRSGNIFSDLKAAASAHGIPVQQVPPAKLDSFNIPEHGGCIGIISKVRYQELQQVISWVVERGESPLFLILDGITDIRNIGGIARTAYCTGVHALVIPGRGVGALNEDAMLTSAGALEKLPVCRVPSLLKAVDEMHLNGIRVLATDMSGSTEVQHADFREPVAIIMGSEDRGITPALLKICDGYIRIPMKNDFESLNVSVAAGIVLFEAMKQRM